MRDTLLDKPVRPVPDRACGDAKRRLLRQARPRTSRCRVLPRKEGENGAGMASLITIVEMIGAGIVEVQRLLNEAQTDDLGVETQVARGLAGDCRDVMDSRHGGRPFL